MKRKTSRALSLILAVVFLAALLPTMALALEPGETEVTSLTQLIDALDPESTDTTVRVRADIDIYDAGQPVALTAKAGVQIFVESPYTLTIGEGGTLTLLADEDGNDHSKIDIKLGGDLRVEEGGTLDLKAGIDQIVTNMDEAGNTSSYTVAAGGTLIDVTLAQPYIGGENATIELTAGEITMSKTATDGFSTTLRSESLANIHTGNAEPDARGFDFVVNAHDELFILTGAKLTLDESVTLIARSPVVIQGCLNITYDEEGDRSAMSHAVTEEEENEYKGLYILDYRSGSLFINTWELIGVSEAAEIRMDQGDLVFTNPVDGSPTTAFTLFVGENTDGVFNEEDRVIATLQVEYFELDYNDALVVNRNGTFYIGDAFGTPATLALGPGGMAAVTGQMFIHEGAALQLWSETSEEEVRARLFIGDDSAEAPLVGSLINAGEIYNEGDIYIYEHSEFINWFDTAPIEPHGVMRLMNNEDETIYGTLINNGGAYAEYLFTHSYNEDGVKEPNGIIVNRSLLAQIYEEQYVVFFDANGGEHDDFGEIVQIDEGGDALAMPLAGRRGHNFKGWDDKEGALHQEGGTVTLTGEDTFTAKWAAVVIDPEPGPIPGGTTPTPKPQEPKPWTNPFTDVDEDDWFYDEVKYCNENKLMDGTSTDEFSPEGIVTRAEVWQVLANLARIETDTTKNPWYLDAQNWAMGIGVTDGTNPLEEVTREQLVTMLYRYYTLVLKSEFEGGMSAKEFSDFMLVSDWAEIAMQWGVTDGIIKGVGGNMLNPQGYATRAELATMLMRFDKLIKG